MSIATDLPATDLPLGVHHGVEFADYCVLPHINISTLIWGLKSAEHLKAALDGRMGKDSQARSFGRALHARLLEPDIFWRDYRVSPGCQELLKTGASAGAPCGNHATWLYQGKWVCGTHVPKAVKQISEPEQNVLSIADARDIENCAAAVKRHEVVRLLRQRGGFEATVRFQIEGIDAKARLDKLIPMSERLPSIVLDLKKVQVGRAADEDVARAIWEWHYDVKAAWYCDAVHIATGIMPQFVWVFVEDGPPYGINVIQADGETLAIGRIRYRECLGKYITGMRTGAWPGYTNRVKVGGLPDYIRRRFKA